MDEQYFYVERSKTEAGVRNVPIAKKILPFFEYWMKKESKCDYLITTREGRHFNDRNYRDSYWKPIIAEIGLLGEHLPLPHDTRHTCVSLLTVAGVQDKVIKKIVGHKGQGVTEMVYTHFELEELIDAIDKI